jgi:hypothetical protein
VGQKPEYVPYFHPSLFYLVLRRSSLAALYAEYLQVERSLKCLSDEVECEQCSHSGPV